jgi:hypothetical protein
VSLLQCISRSATNFWLTGRVTQALVSEDGPQQCQRPLDQALLTTVDKVVNYIVLVSQLELFLPRDSLSGMHTATESPSSNTVK